jgi:hypothetical protein
MRCPVCNRRRKPGHEKKCHTEQAYNEKCLTYKEWCDKNPDRKQEKATLKAEIRNQKKEQLQAIIAKWVTQKDEKDAKAEVVRIAEEKARKVI